MDTTKGPDWAEFTRNLGTILFELERRAKLVLHAEGNRFAQFAAEEDPVYPELVDKLYAGLVSDEFIDEPWRMSPADHQSLAAADWTPPDPGHPDWSTSIHCPAPDDCALLADKVATALRTALRVTRPAELVPDGWMDGRHPNDSHVDVTALGLGPGKISESNALSLVHWYILDQKLGQSSQGLQADRIDGGWVMYFPQGTPAPGRPDDFGTRDFYVPTTMSSNAGPTTQTPPRSKRPSRNATETATICSRPPAPDTVAHPSAGSR